MLMKRVSIAVLVAVVIVSGCATKPPVVEEPAVIEPVQTGAIISDSELSDLHASVLAARKEAFDLGAKDNLSNDYAAAETRYVAGKTALDADDRPTAKAELSAALPLFEDLVTRSARLAAETGRDNAASARERAIASGAKATSPVTLSAADALRDAALAAFDSGDLRNAAALFRKAALAYDAAEKRTRAVGVKTDVDTRNFGPLDSGNYELAGKKLDEVDTTIADAPETANDAASEALLRYNLVLRNGWEITVTNGREAAGEYKVEAENIKAQVAVKDDYAAAMSIWNEAMTYYANEDYATAFDLFAQAEVLFKAVYEKAAAKRAIAEAALLTAAASTERSSIIVEEGDAILGDGTIPAAGNE
ncbi:MAG: hypothetical protein E4H20_02445 [Spirochaetales bacterium]|nr:MAG: hypothetical protein E4H20_02445 [Spirochaetales bacterium]